MIDKKEIIKNIREIMQVNLEVDSTPLADSDPLSGGQNVSLDSMEFMELAFSLEQRFDVPFDEETVSLPEVMVSLETIAEYIYKNIQLKMA